MAVTAPSLLLKPSAFAKYILSEKDHFKKIAAGPFQPTWASLQQFETPEWFRDAKFGMWAHWGPQCQPEYGDWYARAMYEEGSRDYEYHLKKYGHPSKFGFKDVIHEWKAEKWDPEELVELYKNAGAKYFMALANHHDNFDNYNSQYQQWNSTKIGPMKDLIGGWSKAARKNGLRFAVSVHAAHASIFYGPSQFADTKGPLKGVPYDGTMQKLAGKNKWWDGLDPQELYEQTQKAQKGADIGKQWAWGNGAVVPTKKYCTKFFNRTMQLMDDYKPDMVYFDDTALPLWPISDVGLKLAAHFYNSSVKRNGGKSDVVITGKVLTEEQRQCMVWDIERGQANSIQPLPWQTDTCIGNWHYDRPLYESHGYKSAKTVIHTLIDVVSKNGNFMLNIPVRGNGTIDDDERKIVKGITEWMNINSSAIYATRPWSVFGEGPALENAAPIEAQGFNEGKGKPFTPEDIRFTKKDKSLFAFIMGYPESRQALIKSLKTQGTNGISQIRKVSLIGYNERIDWKQTEDGLHVTLPAQAPSDHAVVLKIDGII